MVASATSVIWNSSKHSSAASLRDRSPPCEGIGSSPVPGGAAGMHVPMRLLHELMEVDAALAGDFGGLEEQVHQHALATPDIADEVEAVRVLVRDVVCALAAKKPAKERALRRCARRGVIAAQA